MQIDFITFIDALALVQGVLLGIVLILRNKGDRPSLLLGLFLITFSIELLGSLSHDLGWSQSFPRLGFLPVNFYWLSPALLYLYAKNLVTKLKIRKHGWLLLPGAIEFILFFLLLVFPSSRVDQWAVQWNKGNYEIIEGLYLLGSLFFSLLMASAIIKIVRKHKELVLNFYSNTHAKSLTWVKRIAIALFTLYSMWLLSVIPIAINSASERIIYIILSVFNVVFIYWVALSGLFQEKVSWTEINPKPSTERQKESRKKSSTSATNEKFERDFEMAHSVMLQKKLYTRMDLNIDTLAHETGLSARAVSNAINSQAGSNFNHYVNELRINEAKKMILDKNYYHLNFAGIGMEVGFNSRSTFYSAFKKFTGQTPTQYRKSNQLTSVV